MRCPLLLNVVAASAASSISSVQEATNQKEILLDLSVGKYNNAASIEELLNVTLYNLNKRRRIRNGIYQNTLKFKY